MEQPVNNCIQYSELHGLPYTGPDWSGEMAVAEAVLREKEKRIMVNKTPPGRLAEYLIGDLALARRHIERIRTGAFGVSKAVIDEISTSVEDCVERIERDLKSMDWKVEDDAHRCIE